ncbi:hypothetical protein [Bacteroides nordii]|uniref:hypothetical protein n=1 Tax=Bacteroides nordii TaxID=291645 RepID=UPI00248FF29C|nr:hypothetical protein [Bacteroides nordii]
MGYIYGNANVAVSTLNGQTCPSPYHRSPFGFTAEAYHTSLSADGCVPFITNLCSYVYLPIHIVTAFGRVIAHFSVAKLVCSRVRIKSLVNGAASQIFLYRAGGFAGLRRQK